MNKNISNENIKTSVKECIKAVFPKIKIKKDFINLKIGDAKEWDSLGNFNLLLEVEKKFKIRFKTKDFYNITSIKSIISYIKKIKKI